MDKYTITGMSCAACCARVEKAVSEVEGVTSCSVSLLTNTMGVEGTAPEADIIAAVEAAGYGAGPADRSVRFASVGGGQDKSAGSLRRGEEALKDRESPVLIRRLIASAFFLIVLMYCSMGHTMWNWPLPAAFDSPVFTGIVQMTLSVIVMVINQKFFVNGFKAAFRLSPNMDTLVALGSGASFLYSFVLLLLAAKSLAAGDADAASAYGMNYYFESAAMIPTLITVGKLLEAKSKGRTTDALKKLFKLAPETAVIIENGTERTVNIDEVKIGDVFVVRPGDSIPADGVVVEGSGAVNESALTGESIPVDKKPGDGVNTATVNLNGFMKCRATRVGEDTTLGRIIQLMSDAAATKAPIARIADNVSRIFVPAVIGIALITLLGWLIAGREFSFAIARAITVLVISCPCALGLATPVAIMVGSGVGARHGILYKTAASLEIFGKTKVIALDKTGTVTKGELSVTGVFPAEGRSEDELTRLAASLEYGSEHPVGKAVMRFAAEKNIPVGAVSDFEALPGSGIRAVAEDGRKLAGGSVSYIESIFGLSEEMKTVSGEQASAGKTPVAFASDGEVIGIICVADVIKDDSAEAIKELRAMNVSTVMLTGDGKLTAAAIGKAAGVDEVISGVKPDEKADAVKALMERGKTAMVGDGVNDAPALVTADVGLAIGAGADVAIDAADIVLVNSTLSDVVSAMKLSRATVRNIYENLFWAFIYNIICIPLAIGLFGLALKPMYGAAAMSLSSFCVCMNALRLNLIRPGAKKEDKKMTKVMKIDGMMCMHCEARVKKALEAIPGVENAAPDHEKKLCTVTLSEDVSDSVLKKAVEDQGYKVL